MTKFAFPTLPSARSAGVIGAVVLLFALGVLAACTSISPPESAEQLPASQQESAANAGDTEQATDTTVGDTTDSDSPVQDTADQMYAVSSDATETYKGLPVGFTDDGYPYRGDANAPVTMIEYSDYQCPFCSRYFVQTEPAVDEAFVRDGQLRVVFHDLPLVQLHPNAPAAHEASLCVANQGSAGTYWQMHGELFRTVDEWANAADPLPVFARLAEEVGADPALYDACMASGEQRPAVDERVNIAQQNGFGGTPSFKFVRADDGEEFQLVGAQPFDQFSGLLSAVLAGETPQTTQQQESGGEGEMPFWATAEGLTPDPERPGYNVAGDLYHGSIDAPVVVVEFSDFQCPFCQRHTTQTQPVLDEEFVDTGKVMWVFKHFPLNIHPQAPQAGAAAECAAEQGKFWEMRDLLFADTAAWSVADPLPALSQLASQLDLDMSAFAACLANPASAQRVESDLQDGAALVRGTPTFVVLYNGQGSIIPGALPAERFSEILNEVLAEVDAS